MTREAATGGHPDDQWRSDLAALGLAATMWGAALAGSWWWTMAQPPEPGDVGLPWWATGPGALVVAGLAAGVWAVGVFRPFRARSDQPTSRWLLAAGWGLAAAVAMVVMVRSEAAHDRAVAEVVGGAGVLDRSPVLVVSDPVPVGAGWRLDVRTGDGLRYEVSGYGRAGFALSTVTVGDRVEVSGRARPVGDRAWLRYRHVVAKVAADDIVSLDTTVWWLGPSTLVRSWIQRGADALPERHRPLYTGLVMGDDRFQTLGQKARFRHAGLSHLLVVSGQNVAFVLVAVGPALRRLPIRGRLVATLGVLVVFAAVTRGEPSVLRATATAGLAAWAGFSGRGRTGIQVLSVAVAALLVVDPFLAKVVAFQLSVAASLGILVLAPALARRLPLPRLVAAPLAVTVGAQLAVAPLLIGYFGPMSISTVPANLLAGWAAGAVMTLGLTVGVVAGQTLPAVATVLQTPTSWLLAWIDLSADLARIVPLPQVGGAGLIGLILGLVAFGLARPSAWRRWGFGLVAVAWAVVVAAGPPSLVPVNPDGSIALASGASYWPASDTAGSVLVVDGLASPAVIDALLANHIDSVDLVVTTSGSRQAGRIVAGIGDVAGVGQVLAPPQHSIREATRLTEPMAIPTESGRLLVDLADRGHRLAITYQGR